MAKYLIPFGFIIFLGLFSCNGGERMLEEERERILTENIEEIEQYLVDNNLSAERTENDLFYIIEEEGDGSFPTINDDVTVDYHGYFPSGQVFDSSVDRGTPATFPLSRVISGWQEGIPLFSKGGKGVLLIPSQLAYGENGIPGSIPANAVLIFDVDLINF
jgi:FKBP-type peptidyl-prolyl cis-trans isomerase